MWVGSQGLCVLDLTRTICPRTHKDYVCWISQELKICVLALTRNKCAGPHKNYVLASSHKNYVCCSHKNYLIWVSQELCGLALKDYVG
ncbi:hypothetical protein J6590_004296 [Homalodisca vitripennis]|nr:hypothetical protein J6590_004296 [Homalodisca vitripennis]